MRVKSEKQPSMYGVRMLIRKVGLKAKGRWDKHFYIVIEIPKKGKPVYRVQRESGDSTVKTQQRELLLPFSAIPSSLDLVFMIPPPHLSETRKPTAPVHKQSRTWICHF